jgi:transcriptional regulator with XRE-family HTH domain
MLASRLQPRRTANKIMVVERNPVHQTPEYMRRRLRVELKQARQAAGFTQKDVAKALEWSPSKIIRIEAGEVAVTPTDLRVLLDHYGVRDKRRIDDLIVLARASRKQPWNDYRDVYTPQSLTLFGYEPSASIIREFEPLVVPGLLQTEEYARAILVDTYGKDKETLDRVVEARLERQELLDRNPPPEMFFILDEAVIRRAVGGIGVMRRQLNQLGALGSRPNISIQIVPFTVGAHFGLRGPFTILEFPDPNDDDLLYLENTGGEVTTREDPKLTADYLQAFWDLEAQATDRRDLGAVLKEASDRFPEQASQDTGAGAADSTASG